jgi:acyl-CoA thioester hydrolase
MPDSFIIPIQVRWSDLDPNYHVRHSVYYDYGAYCRICFLNTYGVTAGFFNQNHFGPILFREECLFRREIRLDDSVTIDLQLVKAKRDYSRWTVQHIITRNNDHAATLSMDGAWIDTIQRKLTIPHELARESFENMPRTEGFEWIK